MKKTASEVINSLEKRVAKLEKRSSEMLLLANIKQRMEDQRLSYQDMMDDSAFINLDEIGFQHSSTQSVIRDWIRKGYAENIEGEQEYGYATIDVDMKILTRKGVKYVIETLRNHKKARSSNRGC